jgi:hypothetical protein
MITSGVIPSRYWHGLLAESTAIPAFRFGADIRIALLGGLVRTIVTWSGSRGMLWGTGDKHWCRIVVRGVGLGIYCLEYWHYVSVRGIGLLAIGTIMGYPHGLLVKALALAVRNGHA